MTDDKPKGRPVTAGELSFVTKDEPRKTLPNGQLFQCHLDNLEWKDFGEGEKLSGTFIVDEGEYKGQRFFKTFNPNASGPRATLTKLAFAVFSGDAPEGAVDPVSLVGKPIQVMFNPGNFNGQDYQEQAYLPPVPGQKVPKSDTVLGDLDSTDIDAELDAVFGAK